MSTGPFCHEVRPCKLPSSPFGYIYALPSRLPYSYLESHNKLSGLPEDSNLAAENVDISQVNPWLGSHQKEAMNRWNFGCRCVGVSLHANWKLSLCKNLRHTWHVVQESLFSPWTPTGQFLTNEEGKCVYSLPSADKHLGQTETVKPTIAFDLQWSSLGGAWDLWGCLVTLFCY